MITTTTSTTVILTVLVNLHNLNPLVKCFPLVSYSVSGLRPLTNYTIRVSVLNGVSGRDPEGDEGRRCEVTATTGDISKLQTLQYKPFS